MGVVYYGTYHFTKLVGYFGDDVPCNRCGKQYKPAVIKDRKWGYIDYIPLLPLGSKYVRTCPICAESVVLPKKAAKNIIKGTAAAQEFKGIIKYDKPNKYREFFVKDMVSGEEFCVATGVGKDECKYMAKERGLKKPEVENI